jgi:hypothetical protein
MKYTFDAPIKYPDRCPVYSSTVEASSKKVAEIKARIATTLAANVPDAAIKKVSIKAVQ